LRPGKRSGHAALQILLATYLLAQILLPLHGLATDKIDSRGDFSWNMYSDDYTCTVAYTLHAPGGASRPLDYDRWFRDAPSSTRVLHRDRLPALHAWLCEHVVPDGGSLTGLVSCSLDDGPWIDLVDPARDLCAGRGARR